MNTALAVRLAGHLIAAAAHAAVPLFQGAAVPKPYQQSIRVSYQDSIAPAQPAATPEVQSDHASSSYRLPVHHPSAPGIPYQGTAPLPGGGRSRWSGPSAFQQQQWAQGAAAHSWYVAGANMQARIGNGQAEGFQSYRRRW